MRGFLKRVRGVSARQVSNVALGLALGLAGGVANAQPDWQPVFAFTGLQGTVNDAVTFDFGDGERLVVGGSFVVRTSAGEVRNLAVWDGTCWGMLGGSFAGDVLDLEVFQGQLFAGGSFTDAGGQPAAGLARWNGTAWDAPGDAAFGTVRALASHSSELVVIGSFTSIGGVTSQGEAAWNGTSWRDLPGDLAGFPDEAISFSGTLIVGGSSLRPAGSSDRTGLMRWNGQSWEAFAGNFNGGVNSLAVHQQRLVVAGSFQEIGGEAVPYLAQWNGSAWSAIGDPAVAPVAVVDSVGGELYAAPFRQSLLVWPGVGTWNGTTWAMIDSPPSGARGSFNLVDGQVIADGQARLDGITWKSLVVDRTIDVTEFLPVSDRLLGTGEYPSLAGNAPQAVAELRGRVWQPLEGLGFAQPPLGGSGLVIFDEHVIAAGELGGLPLAVARRETDTWVSLGEVVGEPGSGIAAFIGTLVVFEDRLIASGAFGSVGGTAANCIAAWDGVSWAALNPLPPDMAWLSVWRTVVHDSALYVTGIASISGVNQYAIMRYANDAWTLIGLPTSSTGLAGIQDMCSYDGELIATGWFTAISGVAAARLARWDGFSWHEFEGGLAGSSPSASAWGLKVLANGDDLYVLGSFRTSGGVVTQGGARWNGTAWTALADSTAYEGTANAAVLHRQELMASRITREESPYVQGLARLGPVWCPADYSGSADPSHPDYLWPDGVVDAADFMAYIDLFAMNHPVVDTTSSSDPSDCRYGIPDGIVDLSDFFHFLDRFVEPCP